MNGTNYGRRDDSITASHHRNCQRPNAEPPECSVSVTRDSAHRIAGAYVSRTRSDGQGGPHGPVAVRLEQDPHRNAGGHGIPVEDSLQRMP